MWGKAQVLPASNESLGLFTTLRIGWVGGEGHFSGGQGERLHTSASCLLSGTAPVPESTPLPECWRVDVAWIQRLVAVGACYGVSDARRAACY